MSGYETQASVIAETGILGYLIQDHEPIDWLRLSPSDFTDPRTRTLYVALAALRDAETPADLASIEDELARTGKLAIVPLTFLSALEPSPRALLDHHADIIRRKSLTRSVLSALARVESAHASGTDGADLLDLMAETASQLSEALSGPEAVSMAHAAASEYRAVLADLERLRVDPDATVGIPTGIKVLDGHIGGIPAGIPTVIGARPGAGKSSLALAIGASAARCGMGVAYYSYEDRRSGFAQRQLANQAGVEVQRIRARTLTAEELSLIGKAAGELGSMDNFAIHHAHGMRVSELCRSVRASMRSGLKLVIVDYVQNMPPPTGKGLDKQAQVEHNMLALSNICGQLDIAVIIVSQLNREVEKRDTKAPKLSDFRDSGTVEQIGKLILALTDSSGDELEISVLKNHNGSRGRFTVRFDRPYCRIR